MPRTGKMGSTSGIELPSSSWSAGLPSLPSSFPNVVIIAPKLELSLEYLFIIIMNLVEDGKYWSHKSTLLKFYHCYNNRKFLQDSITHNYTVLFFDICLRYISAIADRSATIAIKVWLAFSVAILLLSTRMNSSRNLIQGYTTK